MGVKLFLVSIGTVERSRDFAKETQFPTDLLFADPANALYDALGLVKGVGVTFLSIDTPLAIKKRIDEDRTGDLMEIMPRWKPWLPPKSDQGLQQGGMFMFEGDRTAFTHYDPSTSAHADLQALLSKASALTAADCGTDACEVPPPRPPQGR
ncbi:hypothetical protein HYH03_010533 [Edaphochlamys debaryana]|uniref:Uncharacterized protein n=1 Tax=Edaphochlamys debaryana TaxID=47281 RepID=A0A835Y4W6_9CHLO|nr:hypothetical protein HYH03_010533 [Edaphochlamys debaryana]|eukprot:KAG2491089.1 hypothetical protein HYH03_010533 [Edaphochlamys debaryana]